MMPLVIRADASPEIGTGHVMRCLALAEAWQDNGGDVVFVSTFDSPALGARMKNEGIKIIHISPVAGSSGDADETARIAFSIGAKWIVVDGYSFDADYQKRIKDSGLSLLFLDDYGHADHYYADIVLNQNMSACMSLYGQHEPYTRFALGTRYALLRKEFLVWSGWRRDHKEVARKILITLGGSDPANVTLKVIEAVKEIDVSDLEVTVVVGGANQNFDRLCEAVNDQAGFRLIKNAENMPELMAWADIAISAGGSTCWELAFMGLPSCIIALAENQRKSSESLFAGKITEYAGWFEDVTHEDLVLKITALLFDKKNRSILCHNARLLTDGNGARKIIQQMNA
ncbi:MAG: UDP-2,4-diacetamido-2,4,6-trideoxy-beta-L-altropyranose hydrolase [Methanoregula sp.]